MNWEQLGINCAKKEWIKKWLSNEICDVNEVLNKNIIKDKTSQTKSRIFIFVQKTSEKMKQSEVYYYWICVKAITTF